MKTLIKGQPTLEEIRSWIANRDEITIITKNAYGIEITTSGIANGVKYGSHFDENAIIYFFRQKFVSVYVGDITSYSVEIKEKIFCDRDLAEIPTTDFIILKSGEYYAPVYKIVLANSCPYFYFMLNSKLQESKQQTIDLSDSFNENELRLLLQFLEIGKISPRTLTDAISLLIIGDYLSMRDMRQNAMKFIAMNTAESTFNDWLLNKDQLHPVLINLLSNISSFQVAYPNCESTPFRIFRRAPALGVYTWKEYGLIMDQARIALDTLTAHKWSFDGILFTAKERPHSKIFELLISRGVLTTNFIVSDNIVLFSCNLIDIEGLLTLNHAQLTTDIDEAAQLLGDITFKPKTLTPSLIKEKLEMPIYRALDELGFIKISGPLYRLNEENIMVSDLKPCSVDIINFDLQKLRMLQREAITTDEFLERYLNVDGSKPVFAQIFHKVGNPTGQEDQNLNKLRPAMLRVSLREYYDSNKTPKVMFKGTTSVNIPNEHRLEEFAGPPPETLAKTSYYQQDPKLTFNENLKNGYHGELSNKIRFLEETLEALQKQIDKLNKRKNNPGFFDNEANLNFKINLLTDLGKSIITVKTSYQNELNKTTLQLSCCNQFLHKSETTLQDIYTTALNGARHPINGSHSNPLMNFLDKNLHRLGFHISTNIESTITPLLSRRNGQ